MATIRAQISLAVTPDAATRWRQAANEHGLSLNAWVFRAAEAYCHVPAPVEGATCQTCGTAFRRIQARLWCKCGPGRALDVKEIPDGSDG